MKSLKTGLIFACIFLVSIESNGQKSYRSAEILNSINLVIDKVIQETELTLTPKLQKPSETVQSINFTNQYGQNSVGTTYALSYLNCTEEGIFQFGFSSGSKAEIWINNIKVFESTIQKVPEFYEFAYDMYRFSESFKAPCTKGLNKILVKLESAENWKFYLAPVLENGLINDKVQFTTETPNKCNSNWLICGPFQTENTSNISPLDPDALVFKTGEKLTPWTVPAIPFIYIVNPPEAASFKKHSYAEWHYSNGIMLWSILNYSEFTDTNKYQDFVQKVCAFNLEKSDLFEFQYSDLFEIHGYNHRMYRMQMLDDATAPALPYQKLLTLKLIEDKDLILKKVEKFVSEGQMRLPDNTFCRPEPWPQTIWADDLFMSVPYLLQIAKSSGNSKYYDEAAFQVLSFYSHLLDTETKICRHAWVNSPENEKIPYWSRANGWMIWAASEVLMDLPKKHKDYSKIKKVYKQHIDGLISFLDADGFIHQIVNDKTSFTETSSTAMLTLAIARGVRNNWLPESYRSYALRGWDAVSSRIESNGTVKGICEGTSISTDAEYYLKRLQPDHDPRGLGAVITAGLEMYKLNSETDI